LILVYTGSLAYALGLIVSGFGMWTARASPVFILLLTCGVRGSQGSILVTNKLARFKNQRKRQAATQLGYVRLASIRQSILVCIMRLGTSRLALLTDLIPLRQLEQRSLVEKAAAL